MWGQKVVVNEKVIAASIVEQTDNRGAGHCGPCGVYHYKSITQEQMILSMNMTKITPNKLYPPVICSNPSSRSEVEELSFDISVCDPSICHFSMVILFSRTYYPNSTRPRGLTDAIKDML